MTELYYGITLTENDESPEFFFRKKTPYSITPLTTDITINETEQVYRFSHTPPDDGFFSMHKFFRKAQAGMAGIDSADQNKCVNMATVSSPFQTGNGPDISETDVYVKMKITLNQVFTAHYAEYELKTNNQELVLKY